MTLHGYFHSINVSSLQGGKDMNFIKSAAQQRLNWRRIDTTESPGDPKKSASCNSPLRSPSRPRKWQNTISGSISRALCNPSRDASGQHQSNSCAPTHHHRLGGPTGTRLCEPRGSTRAAASSGAGMG